MSLVACSTVPRQLTMTRSHWKSTESFILSGIRSNNLRSVFKEAFVIRGLMLLIRSFYKFSPVANISSSKFVVLGPLGRHRIYKFAIVQQKHWARPVSALNSTQMYLSKERLVYLLAYHLSVSVTLSILLSLLPSPAYFLITILAEFPLPFPVLLRISLCLFPCAPLSLSDVFFYVPFWVCVSLSRSTVSR